MFLFLCILHICRIHTALCHLQLWQTGWGLLGAAAVTRGSEIRVSTEEDRYILTQTDQFHSFRAAGRVLKILAVTPVICSVRLKLKTT